MRSKRGAYFAGTAILGAAFLFVGGCGYKDLPVPHDSVVPKAIEDLRYTVEDKGVKLTWTYPLETIRGDDMVAISSFDLYRAEVSAADYCPTCPVPFGEPIAVPGGMTLVEGQRRTAEYSTSMLRSGYKYFFKVSARNNWWAAGADSNIVTFVWHEPAGAPRGLKAAADDSSVALSWQPVTSLKDGSALQAPVKYQVYKGAGGGGLEKLGVPLSTASYVDAEVVNGTEYRYQVQTLLTIGEDLVAGGMTDEVSVTPYDRVPPAVPTGVAVIQTSGGVKVIWEGSREDDLAGYTVYRKGKGQDFKLLGMVKAPYTIYEDATAGDGSGYRYAVTAVDGAVPPNESNKSKEAAIRH